MSEQPGFHADGRSLALLMALAVLVVLAIWLSRGPSDRPSGQDPTLPPAATNKEPVAEPNASSEPSQPFALLQDLMEAKDPDRRREMLDALRESLTRLPPGEVSDFIVGHLQSGSDAHTGQRFQIGRDGFLRSAPTVRVWLLDHLGRFDPEAAGRVARSILAQPTHPDEWALAMKYQAQSDPSENGRSFLRSKLREMWARDDWALQPSVGYLEAFDVAVYLGGTDLVPDLAALLRDQERRATAHAAYLALDRMVLREADAVLPELVRDPGLLAGREPTRANYLARADMRDAMQRQTLEQYLLRPDLGKEEIAAFAGLFPNANYMVSYNLLTPVITPSGAELAARDRAALQVVTSWQQDVRFTHLKPELDAMAARLEQFVPQSGDP